MTLGSGSLKKPRRLLRDELNMPKQVWNEIEYQNNFFKFANDLLEYHKVKVFEFGDFHREMMDSVLMNRYNGIMLPVGHLKTTLVSICYPLWRAFREENYEICLVSATLNLSKKNLATIKHYAENTPWLQHLVPEDKAITWSRSQIDTTNGNQIYVRAFKPSARGIQPNEIVYDDILRDADISMELIKDIFWHIFYPRGQTKQCKHTIIGTPISEDDLLHEIREKANKKKEWHFLTYPAIIEDEKGNRKPLWKERYTLEELLEIRDSMGYYRFNREYLCNLAGTGAGFFPKEMILQCVDDNLGFSYSAKGQVIIGADFAMSESPTGDYNVFTVVEYSNEPLNRTIGGKKVTIQNPVIIRHIDRYKGAYGQTRRLIDLYQKYNATKIVADNSSFGAKFVQELRSQGIVVDTQDFQPLSRTKLLINLRMLMESDDIETKPPRLVIPASEKDNTYLTTKILLKELSSFEEKKLPSGIKTLASTSEHDDTVMSLGMAVKDAVHIHSFPKKIIRSSNPIPII